MNAPVSSGSPRSLKPVDRRILVAIQAKMRGLLEGDLTARTCHELEALSKLAQQVLLLVSGAEILSRRRSFGSNIYTVEADSDVGQPMAPVTGPRNDKETFAVTAIREIVNALTAMSKPQPAVPPMPSLVELVNTLAIARGQNLDAVAAILQAQIDVRTKGLGSVAPLSKFQLLPGKAPLTSRVREPDGIPMKVVPAKGGRFSRTKGNKR
jgi:hypothetical protein